MASALPPIWRRLARSRLEMDALDQRVDRGRGRAAGDGDGGVVARADPDPGARRGKPFPHSRQQLELAHPPIVTPIPSLRCGRPWSASDHSCTESARPGRDSAPGPRGASACGSRCSSAIALLIFGFLVLTVIDQWSEIQDKGVHFHVLWLIPAFVILPLFYALQRARLGPDPALPRLPHRRRAGAGRLGPADARPLRAGQRPLRPRPGAALRARRGAAADDGRQHRLRTGDHRHLGDRLLRLLLHHPSRPAGPAPALGLPAADPAGDRRPPPEGLRAAGRPRPAGLRPRAAPGGDLDAAGARPARLLPRRLGGGLGRHLLRRPLGQLGLARRHLHRRLGPGARLRGGAGDPGRPRRARRPRRGLRLGDQGRGARGRASPSAR